jgi:hypothetical protein
MAWLKHRAIQLNPKRSDEFVSANRLRELLEVAYLTVSLNNQFPGLARRRSGRMSRSLRSAKEMAAIGCISTSGLGRLTINFRLAIS